ncbi:hypothetical protein B0H15DRAFT_869680 [Mycena belliarum]|uniref:Uncharacterized protein n=1 Tax=Mycena belliarum TaxID=1033014 RepID=A0AAD6XEC4_9AGAR|nr:hypothetical protein B0H15DRAFT_869680 [Mycena belliae]
MASRTRPQRCAVNSPLLRARGMRECAAHSRRFSRTTLPQRAASPPLRQPNASRALFACSSGWPARAHATSLHGPHTPATRPRAPAGDSRSHAPPRCVPRIRRSPTDLVTHRFPRRHLRRGTLLPLYAAPPRPPRAVHLACALPLRRPKLYHVSAAARNKQLRVAYSLPRPPTDQRRPLRLRAAFLPFDVHFN